MAEEAVRFDPLVITGSGVEQNTFDLPAAIDVVDAARIGAAQARVNASEALAGGRLTTTFGADYERSVDERQGFENFIGTTLGVKGRLLRDETDRVAASGFYVQSQWQGERWNFSGGLRHSRVGFKVRSITARLRRRWRRCTR